MWLLMSHMSNTQAGEVDKVNVWSAWQYKYELAAVINKKLPLLFITYLLLLNQANISWCIEVFLKLVL